MRRDEEFAKEAFTRFLTRAGNSLVNWRDATDPPDYFLDLGDLSFAVEVTQVMEMVPVGSNQLPYHGMSESLRHLRDRLEDRARSLNLLRGTYVLDLSPIPNLAAREQELSDHVMRFLADTQDVESTQWQNVIDLPDGHTLQIRKYSSKRGAICEMIGGASAKWGPDIEKEAYALIHEAIRNKTDRLKHVLQNKILLLIDAYHYACPETWQAAVAWPAFLAAPFHTIARVHGNHECQILHSKSPSWMAAA